jgi:hypothetical protein
MLANIEGVEMSSPKTATAVANLLANANFEEPAGAPTTLTGVFKPGASAAPHWTTWNNVEAVTTTDILPSTAPQGGRHMLHVCTTGKQSGVVQQYLKPGTGPQHVISSVWVFVVRGQVAMGTGNGGDTHFDALSTGTGKWEELRAPNGVSPAGEFIVYAASEGGSCYYIDNASVNERPVPKVGR